MNVHNEAVHVDIELNGSGHGRVLVNGVAMPEVTSATLKLEAGRTPVAILSILCRDGVTVKLTDAMLMTEQHATPTISAAA